MQKSLGLLIVFMMCVAAMHPAHAQTAAEQDSQTASSAKLETGKSLPKPVFEPALMALAKFKRFSRQWIVGLERSRLDGVENPAVEERGEVFFASYRAINYDTLEISVRPTGETRLPYTGTMSYYDYIYECQGATEEEALQGDCKPVKKQRFTELFVFSEDCNCWMH